MWNSYQEKMLAASSENIKTRWVSPESLREKLALLPELVPVYQKAFAGEPWYEISKCPGCPRGYSAERPGEACTGCGTRLTEEAYPADALLKDLRERVRANPSFVYAETLGREPVLGAIAYRMSPEKIYAQKYQGRESREAAEIFAALPKSLVWLDEIFADRDRRPSGNLWNLKTMCDRMVQSLGPTVIAFRTINMRLVAKAQRVFGTNCAVREVHDRGSLTGTSSIVIITYKEV